MNQNQADKMLSPQDVARKLQIGPHGVRYLLRTGLLKGTRFGTRCWIIKPADLANYERVRRFRGRPKKTP